MCYCKARQAELKAARGDDGNSNATSGKKKKKETITGIKFNTV